MQRCIQMKMTVIAMLLALGAMQASCAQSIPCSNKKTDSPWKEMGSVYSPTATEIERIFSKGGGDAVRRFYGVPYHVNQDSNSLFWVFEKRREFVEKKCDPASSTTTFTQVFVLLRTSKETGDELCTYEVKEFISDNILTVDQALSAPPTPISSPLRICGTKKGSGSG